MAGVGAATVSELPATSNTRTGLGLPHTASEQTSTYTSVATQLLDQDEVNAAEEPHGEDQSAAVVAAAPTLLNGPPAGPNDNENANNNNTLEVANEGAIAPPEPARKPRVVDPARLLWRDFTGGLYEIDPHPRSIPLNNYYTSKWPLLNGLVRVTVMTQSLDMVSVGVAAMNQHEALTKGAVLGMAVQMEPLRNIVFRYLHFTAVIYSQCFRSRQSRASFSVWCACGAACSRRSPRMSLRASTRLLCTPSWPSTHSLHRSRSPISRR